MEVEDIQQVDAGRFPEMPGGTTCHCFEDQIAVRQFVGLLEHCQNWVEERIDVKQVESL